MHGSQLLVVREFDAPKHPVVFLQRDVYFHSHIATNLAEEVEEHSLVRCPLRELSLGDVTIGINIREAESLVTEPLDIFLGGLSSTSDFCQRACSRAHEDGQLIGREGLGSIEIVD
jgi:hypothetical protein